MHCSRVVRSWSNPVFGKRDFTSVDPQANDNADRYLSLLIECLQNKIYRESEEKAQMPASKVGAQLFKLQRRAMTRFGLYNKWPKYAHTMLPTKKLNTIRHCIEECLRNDIEGDLIETGVWRGGATIFMKAVLEAYGIKDRKVYVADSFTGLPKPDASRYPADEGDGHHRQKFLRIDRDTVVENFKRYDLLDDNVIFIEGFFEDSLPAVDFGRLAVLRLDGDMYASTIQVLETLFDKVSVGGFIIIDDYKLSPCRAAVHDFRDSRGITDPLLQDASGRYWQKTTAG